MINPQSVFVTIVFHSSLIFLFSCIEIIIIKKKEHAIKNGIIIKINNLRYRDARLNDRMSERLLIEYTFLL